MQGLSLTAISRDYCLVVVRELLTAAAILVERRVQSVGASVVVAQGLGSLVARGIFPDQGLNPCPLSCTADS